MSRQSPREVELLEICDYLEKVLRDGSRSSIASTLKLLSRDNCPFTPILKAKGIIESQRPNHINVEVKNKKRHDMFTKQLINQCW